MIVSEVLYRVQAKPTDKSLHPGWQFHESCPDEQSARQLARELNNSRETLQTYRTIKRTVQTTEEVLEP